MKIANLSSVPSPGNTFTSYYVIWTSSDGVQYGTEVDAGGDPTVTVSYYWGHYDAANNRLADFNSTTGTFGSGVNGAITVDVPRNMIGNPTIPITDPNGTPAVSHPFAFTIAGEGAVGTGTTWISLMDRAPNSDLGFGQSWAVCGPPPLSTVVSRKTHGSATFDVPLQNNATATPRGVECRTGGANGNHTLVFTFADNLVGAIGQDVANASVTSGPGSIAAGTGIGPAQNQYTVNLTGVTNGQYVTVALNNLADTAGFSGLVSTTMGVLLGDTTGDGSVNSADISQTKSRSGQVLATANFRSDVTVDGNLNSADISSVKSRSGTALPSAP
jgi:hypothetical protein